MLHTVSTSAATTSGAIQIHKQQSLPSPNTATNVIAKKPHGTTAITTTTTTIPIKTTTRKRKVIKRRSKSCGVRQTPPPFCMLPSGVAQGEGNGSGISHQRALPGRDNIYPGDEKRAKIKAKSTRFVDAYGEQEQQEEQLQQKYTHRLHYEDVPQQHHITLDDGSGQDSLHIGRTIVDPDPCHCSVAPLAGPAINETMTESVSLSGNTVVAIVGPSSPHYRSPGAGDHDFASSGDAGHKCHTRVDASEVTCDLRRRRRSDAKFEAAHVTNCGQSELKNSEDNSNDNKTVFLAPTKSTIVSNRTITPTARTTSTAPENHERLPEPGTGFSPSTPGYNGCDNAYDANIELINFKPFTNHKDNIYKFKNKEGDTNSSVNHERSLSKAIGERYVESYSVNENLKHAVDVVESMTSPERSECKVDKNDQLVDTVNRNLEINGRKFTNEYNVDTVVQNINSGEENAFSRQVEIDGCSDVLLRNTSSLPEEILYRQKNHDFESDYLHIQKQSQLSGVNGKNKLDVISKCHSNDKNNNNNLTQTSNKDLVYLLPVVHGQSSMGSAANYLPARDKNPQTDSFFNDDKFIEEHASFYAQPETEHINATSETVTNATNGVHHYEHQQTHSIRSIRALEAQQNASTTLETTLAVGSALPTFVTVSGTSKDKKNHAVESPHMSTGNESDGGDVLHDDRNITANNSNASSHAACASSLYCSSNDNQEQCNGNIDYIATNTRCDFVDQQLSPMGCSQLARNSNISEWPDYIKVCNQQQQTANDNGSIVDSGVISHHIEIQTTQVNECKISPNLQQNHQREDCTSDKHNNTGECKDQMAQHHYLELNPTERIVLQTTLSHSDTVSTKATQKRRGRKKKCTIAEDSTASTDLLASRAPCSGHMSSHPITAENFKNSDNERRRMSYSIFLPFGPHQPNISCDPKELVPSNIADVAEAPTKCKERKKHERFNGMSEAEVIKRTLPDHLVENLDIVIVGINPGLFAAYKGHHYAGPGNHFWKCLYLSGLTKDQMCADDDYKLLQCGIGFTNMVQRATKGSADLTRKEIKDGSLTLLEKLQHFRPKIAVFNGKLIFEVFSGKKDFNFGRQSECVEGTNTYIWVMPSSSARCAQLPRAADKVPFYTALKKFRDYLNGVVVHMDMDECVFTEKRIRQVIEQKHRNTVLCTPSTKTADRQSSEESQASIKPAVIESAITSQSSINCCEGSNDPNNVSSNDPAVLKNAHQFSQNLPLQPPSPSKTSIDDQQCQNPPDRNIFNMFTGEDGTHTKSQNAPSNLMQQQQPHHPCEMNEGLNSYMISHHPTAGMDCNSQQPCQTLSLCLIPPPEKKKRGRPKKNKAQQGVDMNSDATKFFQMTGNSSGIVSGEATLNNILNLSLMAHQVSGAPTTVVAKKKRGRPKKLRTTLATTTTTVGSSGISATASTPLPHEQQQHLFYAKQRQQIDYSYHHNNNQLIQHQQLYYGEAADAGADMLPPISYGPQQQHNVADLSVSSPVCSPQATAVIGYYPTLMDSPTRSTLTSALSTKGVSAPTNQTAVTNDNEISSMMGYSSLQHRSEMLMHPEQNSNGSSINNNIENSIDNNDSNNNYKHLHDPMLKVSPRSISRTASFEDVATPVVRVDAVNKPLQKHQPQQPDQLQTHNMDNSHAHSKDFEQKQPTEKISYQAWLPQHQLNAPLQLQQQYEQCHQHLQPQQHLKQPQQNHCIQHHYQSFRPDNHEESDHHLREENILGALELAHQHQTNWPNYESAVHRQPESQLLGENHSESTDHRHHQNQPQNANYLVTSTPTDDVARKSIFGLESLVDQISHVPSSNSADRTANVQTPEETMQFHFQLIQAQQQKHERNNHSLNLSDHCETNNTSGNVINSTLEVVAAAGAPSSGTTLHEQVGVIYGSAHFVDNMLSTNSSSSSTPNAMTNSGVSSPMASGTMKHIQDESQHVKKHVVPSTASSPTASSMSKNITSWYTAVNENLSSGSNNGTSTSNNGGNSINFSVSNLATSAVPKTTERAIQTPAHSPLQQHIQEQQHHSRLPEDSINGSYNASLTPSNHPEQQHPVPHHLHREYHNHHQEIQLQNHRPLDEPLKQPLLEVRELHAAASTGTLYTTAMTQQRTAVTASAYQQHLSLAFAHQPQQQYVMQHLDQQHHRQQYQQLQPVLSVDCLPGMPASTISPYYTDITEVMLNDFSRSTSYGGGCSGTAQMISDGASNHSYEPTREGVERDIGNVLANTPTPLPTPTQTPTSSSSGSVISSADNAAAVVVAAAASAASHMQSGAVNYSYGYTGSLLSLSHPTASNMPSTSTSPSTMSHIRDGGQYVGYSPQLHSLYPHHTVHRQQEHEHAHTYQPQLHHQILMGDQQLQHQLPHHQLQQHQLIAAATPPRTPGLEIGTLTGNASPSPIAASPPIVQFSGVGSNMTTYHHQQRNQSRYEPSEQQEPQPQLQPNQQWQQYAHHHYHHPEHHQLGHISAASALHHQPQHEAAASAAAAAVAAAAVSFQHHHHNVGHGHHHHSATHAQHQSHHLAMFERLKSKASVTQHAATELAGDYTSF